MYTISSEPHPVSWNASSGPCHGKARLTRDPQAFQVLRRRDEKKETKKKKIKKGRRKITNHHLAIKLFDAGSPEKLSASEIPLFMQRNVLSAVKQNCRRGTIFLRSHTCLFPFACRFLQRSLGSLWSGENGGKERFRETNRSVVIPNNYHVTFEPRALCLYRNRENNRGCYTPSGIYFCTLAVSCQLPVVFHFLISALLSAPADSSSLLDVLFPRASAPTSDEISRAPPIFLF